MIPANTPSDSTACVYALCEPEEPYAVRYVGVTVDLDRRLRSHKWESHQKHKYEWIRSLKGASPHVEILQSVTGYDTRKRYKAERRWVVRYRKAGADLLNSEYTYQARVRGPMPPEQKEKIRQSRLQWYAMQRAAKEPKDHPGNDSKPLTAVESGWYTGGGTTEISDGTVLPLMTLRELRVNLGWSQNQLAVEAGISPSLIKRAEDGKPMQARTAKALADALSKAYGREIRPIDIAGLNIL